ncbi:MAG: Spy/CpxP family protein refolding chaperone [Porticoccaceae bacterium]
MNSVKKIAITAIAIGAVGFSALSLAHPADRHKGGWHGGKHMHHGEMAGAHFYQGRGLERMAKQLELTDAQKEEIKKIVAESRDAAKPLREKLQASMEAERTAFADDSSERELKKLARATADSRVDLMLHHRAAQEKVEQVLNDDQKTRLEQQRAERKAKMAERMEKRQGKRKSDESVTE